MRPTTSTNSSGSSSSMQSLFNPFRPRSPAADASKAAAPLSKTPCPEMEHFTMERLEQFYTHEARQHASRLADGFMQELKPRPEPLRAEEFSARVDAMVQLGQVRMGLPVEREGCEAPLNPTELEKEAQRQQEVMETLHDIVQALSKPPCRPGMYEIEAELAGRCRKFPEAREALCKWNLVLETYWQHHVLERREVHPPASLEVRKFAEA